MAQMGRMNQAGEVFQQALELERNKAVVNNVAALTRQDGDIDGAMKLLNEAAGAGSEVGYNKGIILIQKGDYASAISNMGRVSSVNVALAKMLNGDAAGARRERRRHPLARGDQGDARQLPPDQVRR